MGTTLTGLTPATTYDALIKVGDNEPLTASLKVLSDGVGTNLPMEASTTGVNFTGNLTQSGTALQPVLVSGTNIKTINSTSILGSGNIAVVTSPSGVSGAIQFSNGSAFASDAANLFWDDTNNRLGIGTNVTASALNFGVNSYITYNNLSSSSYIGEFGINNCLGLQITGNNPIRFLTNSVERMRIFGSGNTAFGSITDLSAMVGIKGSGSTSATTSLLVQNSSGSQLLKITDDGSAKIGGNGTNGKLNFGRSSDSTDMGTIEIPASQHFVFSEAAGNGFRFVDGYGKFPLFLANGKASVNKNAIADASAQFEVVSTTGGILFPRMTTTEKNAIATPAAGLVVYDSTTNKLCCYNGSTWNDLF